MRARKAMKTNLRKKCDIKRKEKRHPLQPRNYYGIVFVAYLVIHGYMIVTAVIPMPLNNCKHDEDVL